MPAPVPWLDCIDASKAHLDIALHPDHATFRLGNDVHVWAALVDRITAAVSPPVVRVATGGCHVGVVLALAKPGTPPAVMKAHFNRLRLPIVHIPMKIACARQMPRIQATMVGEGITRQQTEFGQRQFRPDSA